MSVETTRPVPVADLVAALSDAHARTLALVDGLDDAQLMGPRLPIVNPLLWEIGHVAWFHEYFVLRWLDGRESMIAGTDALYDSMKVPHDTRWDLPLPSFAATVDYMRRVRDAVAERLPGEIASVRDSYHTQLTLFHEDMHDEAFTWTRQTLRYPAPKLRPPAAGAIGEGPFRGDAEIPGGWYRMGATGEEPFVFDNEKWAHVVEIAPFTIAKAPVTNAEFAAFVDEGGYERRDFWDAEGWTWRERERAGHPVYWRRDGGSWFVRRFDEIAPLAPHHPVIHVNWHEARAWCRWARRRLPTEAEWELAASGVADSGGRLVGRRRFPWGDDPPTAARANLEGGRLGCVDVGAYPQGDNAFGCRQMIGNVWEWTASDFDPYPGFSADPYRDYSLPWFHTHKVTRGGCWATRARLIWNTWRNFALPHRRDLFTGFRTCAL
jgi:iron(II)-dependent oxidoreductase